MQREDREDELEGTSDEQEWDPNLPDDPDYDLSEAAGYAGYDSSREFPSRALVVIVSLILVAALLAPFLLRIVR